jgi:hypothetical protein
MASTLQLGEAELFDYLLGKTSDTEDTHAFRNELPALFDDASIDYIWAFFYKGGGLPSESRQLPGRSCGVVGEFMFDGAFTSKATAQTYACLLRNNLPPDVSTLTYVNYLLPTQDPLIERAVVKRGKDQATSGEARVWHLTAVWEAGIKST